jgi:PAS domain S-box-containing protein
MSGKDQLMDELNKLRKKVLDLEKDNRLFKDTEKKLQAANQQLQASEQQLKSKQETLMQTQRIARVGSWEWDVASDTVSWSDELFQIFRLNPEKGAVSYADHPKLYTPESMKRLDKVVRHALETGEPYKMDLEIVRADGTFAFCTAQGYAKKDAKGKVFRLYGSLQDITERKNAEEDFIESEERFRELVNTINSGVAIYKVINDGKSGSDYIIKEFNEFALKHEQLQKKDIIGRSLKDIRPNIDEYGLIDMFQKVWKTGEATFFPAKVYVDKKYSNYYENRVFRLPSGEIVAIYDEVSDRENAIAQIKESRERFDLAMKASNDGLFDWNLETNEIYYSPRWKSMLGYEDEELPNDFTIWERLTELKDVERSWKMQQELIDKQRDRFEMEFKMKHKDGHWVYIFSRAEAIFDDEGKAVRMIGTHIDISERKQAELELITAKRKAEESDRLKSSFLANMSHEIRTPMNGILGFSGLLKEPKLSGEEQQKYIGIIEKSGIRMLNIINDIIDISKIESGLMTLDIKESDINEQIEYIYTFFKPEVEAKGMKLSFKNTLPAKEAIIKTDREKVFAILTNLVKNAIKYTNKGSVEFGYCKKGGFLEFFVKDTGIGIPKERQVAIFERFVQADINDIQARQGAGLGLAITKAYTKMLGGKIWVDSQEGKGSSFYFTIPYHATFKKETRHDTIDLGDDLLKLDLKILIVEDDETSNQLLSIIMGKYGKEILNVINGNKAVETCRNNPDIDLVLLDIQIPEINGYEVARQIRKFNKEVIIIAQTAYGLTGDREKAIKVGCNDYISKPINKDELFALINKQSWF